MVDWRPGLLAIVGARGVGKTTLLLQHCRAVSAADNDCLYLTADHAKVSALGLYEIAKAFVQDGGKTLLVDEVHKYPKWTEVIKNIHDTFPKLQLIISGSSAYEILKGGGDLSRRLVVYEMHGLSFREYLVLKAGFEHEVLKLDQILKGHVSIARAIVQKVPVIRQFKNYLKSGYYPFFLEGEESYFLKLNNVVEKVLYEDIATSGHVKPSSIIHLRKLLHLVATSHPFEPNMDRVSLQLQLSKEYVYNYVEYLERARLFSLLYPAEQGFKLARKPKKIYMQNSNLIYAVAGKEGFRMEIGSAREACFLNQLKVNHHVHWTPTGDFLLDDKFIFEIGGPNKTSRQIKNISDAFVVSDGLEIGHKNHIPLWLFGFLY